MRLISKLQEYPTTKVIICTEEYTSVTCGECGKYNYRLKGKKIFNCPWCNQVMDRDANGARNIFIKTINEWEHLSHLATLCPCSL